MDDQELAAIRAARLQQLRQNASPVQTSSSPQLEGLPTGGGPGASDPDADAKRAAEEQMRRDLLVTVLDSKARERRGSRSRFLFTGICMIDVLSFGLLSCEYKACEPDARHSDRESPVTTGTEWAVEGTNWRRTAY